MVKPLDDRASEQDPTDADLVRAALGGDRRAYALLVERHWSLLYALCRRALGDPWLADDAAQEATLQGMLSLGSLRRPEAFSSWLAGIGLNVCRRLLKDSRTRNALSWEALLGGVSGSPLEVADTGPSPAEVVEAAELGERVRAAVDSLPAGQRSAVLLFYLSGLSHREVALALEIEVGAVKTRLHKARRSLRRRLACLWSEPDSGRTKAGGGIGEAVMSEEEKMTDPKSELVPVRIADVRRVPEGNGAPTMHVVLLEEVGGERRLCIWMGEWEALSLAMQLTGQQPPRPMTYTLVAALLGEVGGKVRQVTVSRLAGNVFYASVEVVGPDGKSGTVDSRPSDALNVALAAGAPIYVEAGVFDAVSHPDTPPPYPSRDAFGPGTVGASELVAAAMTDWPKPPTR